MRPIRRRSQTRLVYTVDEVFRFCSELGIVTPLEERIGYKFRNSLLLAEALTHPSLGHEAQRYHFDYQRLEFLGDAVLQLVITEYLFSNFRVEAEGQLTKLRSRLVSREAFRTHAAALISASTF